jgi:hypothetical protein
MTAKNPFNQYPSSELTREDVIAYLIQYKQKGWDIYRGDSDNEFIIRATETQNVYVYYAPAHTANNEKETWVVSFGLNARFSSISGYPENLIALEEAIKFGIRIVGNVSGLNLNWLSSPSSVRLYKTQPATNLNKIVGLIGISTIEAIYDTYLSNNSLATILDMETLGIKISPNIRLLTSTGMMHPSKGTPQLTQSYLANWFNQLGCSGGQVRHKQHKGHDRRFILLSGAKSLLLGFSLNNLSVNEASSVEADTEDKTFFDSEWNTASV